MKNLNVKDPELRMILDMPCTFVNYDVSYDSEKMIKEFEKRAQKFNVKLDRRIDSGYVYGNGIETCSGTVENCIRYLRQYIEADYGYIAGQCLNIKAKPTKKFKAVFQKFINWISESDRFEDFKKGVEIGDMANFMK